MPRTPRLEFRHLAMLSALAETGSITRTGDRLGLTQSAVTHRLREAERRVGRELVRRVGRRVLLTPAAERLCLAAERCLDELSRAEEEVRVGAGEPARTVVRFVQDTYSRYHWLPPLLRALEDEAPDLELDLVARATYQPLAALAEGAIDVASVYGRRGASPQFTWTPLAFDPLVAIMAPNHRLAERDYLVPEDLASERYITYSATVEPGFEWEAFLRPAGVAPARLSVVQSPEAIIDLVRAGFGISALSRWAVEPEIADGTLVCRPLGRKGLWQQWWNVVRTTDGPDSPAWRLSAILSNWAERARNGLATLGFEGGTGDRISQ